jgi:hypothetical protein
MKRALFDETAKSAGEDAQKGEEILRVQISQRGDADAYPYAALVVHKMRYLKRWKPLRMGEQLEELYKLAQVGSQKHPFDQAMRDAYQEVFREYLMQAVKAESIDDTGAGGTTAANGERDSTVPLPSKGS